MQWDKSRNWFTWLYRLVHIYSSSYMQWYAYYSLVIGFLSWFECWCSLIMIYRISYWSLWAILRGCSWWNEEAASFYFVKIGPLGAKLCLWNVIEWFHDLELSRRGRSMRRGTVQTWQISMWPMWHATLPQMLHGLDMQPMWCDIIQTWPIWCCPLSWRDRYEPWDTSVLHRSR